MKNDILITIVVTCLVPAILVSVLSSLRRKSGQKQEISITQENTEMLPTENISQPDVKKTIFVLTESGVTAMELEQYVTCVVLAEMPASFEIEALKAQAVVARTYTCKHSLRYKHDEAMVCTDSTCCQAYISEDGYLQSGGTEEMIQKVRQAVCETNGEVLYYQGELIEATYFSCSGGRTESAQAVWGGDIPYLQAVDSPGEEIAAHYTDTVRFSAEEFCRRIGVTLTGNPELWVDEIIYTQGGGVDSIVLDGNVFSGVTIRSLLDLRSTAFIITAIGNTIVITTKGYGHRVGMSQYGAEAMALQGEDYKGILAHYYCGTTIQTIFS